MKLLLGNLTIEKVTLKLLAIITIELRNLFNCDSYKNTRKSKHDKQEHVPL